MKQTLVEKCKSANTTLAELSRISGESTATLRNWHKNPKPNYQFRLDAVIDKASKSPTKAIAKIKDDHLIVNNGCVTQTMGVVAILDGPTLWITPHETHIILSSDDLLAASVALKERSEFNDRTGSE